MFAKPDIKVIFKLKYMLAKMLLTSIRDIKKKQFQNYKAMLVPKIHQARNCLEENQNYAISFKALKISS